MYNILCYDFLIDNIHVHVHVHGILVPMRFAMATTAFVEYNTIIYTHKNPYLAKQQNNYEQ